MTALIPSNRMDPEDRKGLLVQATLRCLKQYGFQGTSVRRICAEAKVSVGLISHHYDSKDNLIAQTYLHISNSILQRLRLACAQAGTQPRQQLNAFFAASFAPEILDPSVLETWIAFWGAVRSTKAMSQAHDTSYSQYRSILAGSLEGLAREHAWHHFDAQLAAISLSALLDGLWLESSLNPNTFTPAQGMQVCDAWVDGLVCGAYRNYLQPFKPTSLQNGSAPKPTQRSRST